VVKRYKLKSDNFVVVASALVVTSKLIRPNLVNAGATSEILVFLPSHTCFS
jgi:hypothetical protein